MGIVEKMQSSFDDKFGIELTKKQVSMIIVCLGLFLVLFVMFFSMDRIKSDPAGTKLTPAQVGTAPLFEGK